MVTSGRPVLLLVALLALGSAVGCGRPSDSQPRQTATAAPSGTPPPSGQDGPARQQETFCTVDLPESWRSALAQGKISLPDTERLNPTVVAADGSQVFGALYSDAWSGVVAVDRQGSLRRIRAFSNPAADQARAAFDGRWLVWEESHSLTNWSDWDIRAWDSRSGDVFDIATALRVNGDPVSGPFVIPVVSRGRAAWLQAEQSGALDVHLYDLAEGRDRVLSSGNALLPVVFWDGKLLWGERFQEAGREAGHLVMADPATGEPLEVPEPLASIRGLGTLAASDDLVAWTEDYQTLSLWRVGEADAERIFATGVDDGVDWVKIAGDIVAWVGLKGAMVADVRSQSAARLMGAVNVLTNGRTLLVLTPVGPVKKEEPGNLVPGVPVEVSVVDVTKLPPLPTCPS